jgi:UDP-3-O-[3-hydroxymyristoyl] N-acetylglucosamine deacetylase
MPFQRTVKSEILCRSVGLHSGRKVGMTIKPGEVDGGIVFVRRDIAENNSIVANCYNVSDTTLATTLGTNGTQVATVEHLLSALSGLGIDNAVVELDSFEVPIMDGSALPFVNLLKSAGIRRQHKHRKFMVIKKPFSVTEGDSYARLEPSPEFRITYKIDFPHPVVGQQSYEMVFSDAAYEREISNARTFGFLKDVEYLQARGLALGGSLNNAIVLDDEKVINRDGLRCPNEFVKHKILDAIGDLFLIGMPIIGHFVAYKSGHKLNVQLVKELLANQACWEVVTYTVRRDGRQEELKAFPSLNALNVVPTS